MKNILMLIPAYNEEDNIGELLSKITEQNIEETMDVLVIDDGFA